MSSFKLKRRPDLGNGGGEMTLAEHINSANPHPSWNPTVNQQGNSSEITRDDVVQMLSAYLTKQVANTVYLSKANAATMYAVIDHTHPEYEGRGASYSGGGIPNSESGTSSLNIPSPTHAAYAEVDGKIDASKPTDQGVVYADALLSNKRYIIDTAQVEQLYDASGNELPSLSSVKFEGFPTSSLVGQLVVSTGSVQRADGVTYHVFQEITLDSGDKYVRSGIAGPVNVDMFVDDGAPVVTYQRESNDDDATIVSKSVNTRASYNGIGSVIQTISRNYTWNDENSTITDESADTDNSKWSLLYETVDTTLLGVEWSSWNQIGSTEQSIEEWGPVTLGLYRSSYTVPTDGTASVWARTGAKEVKILFAVGNQLIPLCEGTNKSYDTTTINVPAGSTCRFIVYYKSGSSWILIDSDSGFYQATGSATLTQSS